jgi:hypothetical protein
VDQQAKDARKVDRSQSAVKNTKPRDLVPKKRTRASTAQLSADDVSVIRESTQSFFANSVAGLANFFLDKLLELQSGSPSGIRLSPVFVQEVAIRYAGVVRRAAAEVSKDLSQAVGARQGLGEKQKSWIQAEVETFVEEKTSASTAHAFFETAVSSLFNITNQEEAKVWLAENLARIGGGSLLTQSTDRLRHSAAIYGGERKQVTSYRSPLKRAVALHLTRSPNATDLELCRWLDDEGAVELPPNWAMKANRSYEAAYMVATIRKKMHVVFSKVRGDMRHSGLL